MLPPTLGEHVEQNVSLATSSGTRFLLRLVCATVLRRATVCAIVHGSGTTEARPPERLSPARNGVGGIVAPHGQSPRGIFGAVHFSLFLKLVSVHFSLFPADEKSPGRGCHGCDDA